jgi:hypothetical protein
MNGTKAIQRPAVSGALLGGPLVLAVLPSLGGGIAGGLLRAGTGWPQADWGGAAIVGHGFLMICGFMGTVIGIERAVALKRAWAFSASAASGAAGLAMLAGGRGRDGGACRAGFRRRQRAARFAPARTAYRPAAGRRPGAPCAPRV